MEYQEIKKYKYTLSVIEVIDTGIRGYSFDHEFFNLTLDGLLTIYKHYKWDGVSGPTWDTKSTMIPGLGHDALYQAIRLKLLPVQMKDVIDLFFYSEMLRCKVWAPRAKYFYKAVAVFGHNSCIPGNTQIPEVLTA